MKIVNVIAIAFFAVSNITIAQNYNTSDNVSNNDFNRNILFLDQVGNNFRDETIVDNNVFLRQIGERNLSDVFIASNKSNINIFQYGNDNEVDLKIAIDEVTENIVQIGDNNLYKNISLLRVGVSREVDIYQRGIDQKIIINGSNGLSEKMKIKQIGDSKELIINNYN